MVAKQPWKFQRPKSGRQSSLLLRLRNTHTSSHALVSHMYNKRCLLHVGKRALSLELLYPVVLDLKWYVWAKKQCGKPSQGGFKPQRFYPHAWSLCAGISWICRIVTVQLQAGTVWDQEMCQEYRNLWMVLWRASTARMRWFWNDEIITDSLKKSKLLATKLIKFRGVNFSMTRKIIWSNLSLGSYNISFKISSLCSLLSQAAKD